MSENITINVKIQYSFLEFLINLLLLEVNYYGDTVKKTPQKALHRKSYMSMKNEMHTKITNF